MNKREIKRLLKAALYARDAYKDSQRAKWQAERVCEHAKKAVESAEKVVAEAIGNFGEFVHWQTLWTQNSEAPEKLIGRPVKIID